MSFLVHEEMGATNVSYEPIKGIKFVGYVNGELVRGNCLVYKASGGRNLK